MAFPGMGERLQQEVRTLAPSNMKVCLGYKNSWFVCWFVLISLAVSFIIIVFFEVNSWNDENTSQVEVRVTSSPSLYPWQGGASLAKVCTLWFRNNIVLQLHGPILSSCSRTLICPSCVWQRKNTWRKASRLASTDSTSKSNQGSSTCF